MNRHRNERHKYEQAPKQLVSGRQNDKRQNFSAKTYAFSCICIECATKHVVIVATSIFTLQYIEICTYRNLYVKFHAYT